MPKELGVSYNVSKLEPKLKPHQFPGFLNGLSTDGTLSVKLVTKSSPPSGEAQEKSKKKQENLLLYR